MENLRKKQEDVFDGLENLKKDSNVSMVSAAEDFEQDPRICLTMLYFLPRSLQERIKEEIIEPLRKEDPDQYYYSVGQMHATIQNVRVVADPPNFTEKDVESLNRLAPYFSEHEKLSFDVEGLWKLPTSIGIRCYPNLDTQQFILNLRKRLSEIGLSDDKKYFNSDTVIGNITICRFYKPPSAEFFHTFEKLRKKAFGRIDIDKVSLVSCNVVCYKDTLKVLDEFFMNSRE
jgi:hypothetical protein